MPRYAHLAKGAHWIGLSGLYLFSLSGGISTAGFNVGLYLMLIALLIQLPVDGRRLLREPLLWSSLLFGLYLLYTANSAITEFPDTVDFQTKRAWRWFMISGFFSLVCAWWIGARARHPGLLLILALAGFLLTFALKTDWSHWPQYINGAMRIDMNSLNPNKTGWYAAMFCCGLLVFGYHYAKSIKRTSLAMDTLRLSLIAALSVFFALFLLWSQSRAAWLAFAVALLLLFLLLMFRGRSPGKHSLKFAGLMLVAFMLSLYFLLQSDIVQDRITAESEAIASLTTDQPGEQPLTSIGIRFMLWEFGAEKFQERPLMGWGLGTIDSLARAHTDEIANHLHNFYLETLVGLGLIGTALLALNIVIILRMAWRAYLSGKMQPVIGILLLSLFIITAVFQLFSTHLGTQGKFLVILLGGLAYAYAFRGDSAAADTETAPLKE